MSPRRKRAGLKRRHWTLRENRIYLQYLRTHYKDFQDYKSKRTAGVFVTIARALKTRKSQQVKSHHQKLMEKCGSLTQVVAFLLEEQQVFAEQSPFQQEVRSESEAELPGSLPSAAIDPEGLVGEIQKANLIKGTSFATKSEDKSNSNQQEDVFGVLNSYEWSQQNYSPNSYFSG